MMVHSTKTNLEFREMKILVESGATKSDWRILDEAGVQKGRILKAGMNVSTVRMSFIKDTLSEAISQTGLKRLDGFYLYTAGIITSAIREELTSHIHALIKVDDIDIEDDLMGAARSLYGHSEGIVAIMGTGSNTCLYDGERVFRKVMSGGYVLGDHGSAATLGKLFLSAFLKNEISEKVAEEFASRFDSSYAAIVENVYRSPAPSRYLGSLAPFIVSHYDDPCIKEMVDSNFQSFIDLSLKKYDTTHLPVGVVGGFGYACRDIFLPLAEKAGIDVNRIVAEPVSGLLEYHCA